MFSRGCSATASVACLTI